MLGLDFQQILLHLLNFVILAGGLYLLLYKPVKSFMGKRQALYESREAETKQLREDAAALKAEYEARLRQAEEDIQRDREKYHEEAEAEKQRLLAEAREQARGILNTATQTAELRSKKTIEDARAEIRAMAEGMVEKLVLQSGGDALDQFLDQAESEHPHG